MGVYPSSSDVVSVMSPNDPPPGRASQRDALMVLLPMLVVLSTLLFLLLLFLLCVILVRRRRGIILGESDGPVDLSREELLEGAGGFAGVESRWLESVSEDDRRRYLHAKDYQTQYPPNSLPTDITLSQFLSIQEKGVSAWCFEPDYESMPSLLVHARTELTFLPDPSSSSSVQSNLPLPKLNEVYYWEVKMFDLPPSTTVSVGLATKPYPSFRLPGLNRYSIAYHSNGDKSYNYPFTSTPYGAPLKEGDVLGVGYRPRSGTVFFTRNGRKMEDAFVGLGRWNLFPSIGADGPCSVHVNLGQAGFVHIEANVKKWGLAPSVGTLAPPPAYGSERGSILLEAGTGAARTERPISPPPSIDDAESMSSSHPRNSPHHRSAGARNIRRPKLATSSTAAASSTAPINPSPLRGTPLQRTSSPPTPIPEEDSSASSHGRYISPTDVQYHAANSARRRFAQRAAMADVEEGGEGDGLLDTDNEAEDENWMTSDEEEGGSPSGTGRTGGYTPPLFVRVSPPDSPDHLPNPPTPNITDIHLHPITSSPTLSPGVVEPPAYSPVDAQRYPNGVTIDIPADILAAALEDTPRSASRR